jgi:type I restriction enzyme, S subunit
VSNWIKVKLGDIVELKRESYQPQPDEVLPYIGLEHIGQGTLRLISVGKSNEVTSTKSYFSKGDILFGKLRPYFRKVVRPKFNGVCSTDILVLTSKNPRKFNQTFLFYLMASQEMIDLATSSSSGTKMPRADWKVLQNLEISIPEDVNEQERIGKILETIDDKIDINIRMNKTLEEMAMTLYKHWFVDFGPFQDGEFVESELGMIPNGWDVVQLSNVVNTQYGYTQSASVEKIGPHFLRITDIQENFISWNRVPYCSINEKDYGKYMLKKGDIVIARTGNSTGAVGYINSDVEAVFASFLVRLQPKNEQVSPHYLYLLTTSEGYQTYLNNVANGSARKGANAKVMTEYKIALPPKEVMYEFHNKVDSLLELIEQNIRENIELEQIRDYLLPRLLSGEIDLSQAEKQVEEVL